jgi:hypothetical protein
LSGQRSKAPGFAGGYLLPVMSGSMTGFAASPLLLGFHAGLSTPSCGR